MECKVHGKEAGIELVRIRIKPDWNVKEKGFLTDPQGLGIRIKPDWNVKFNLPS